MLHSKQVLTFLQLTLCFGYSKSRNAECSFTTTSYLVLGSSYFCEVRNNLDIISPQSTTIDSISRSHISGKGNDDVISFAAYDKNIQYFPKGLERIFKNLKTIRITNGRLKEIHQEDLKPFPKLVEIIFGENDIEILEEGLFGYNPDLVLISLTRNKIVHIGENIFENLIKLTNFYLKSNPCINMLTENNRTAVIEIVKEAKTKCMSPEFVTLEKNLLELEEDCAFIRSRNFSSFKNKTKDFEKKFYTSKFANYFSISKRFEDISKQCQGSFWTIRDKIIEVTENVKDLQHTTIQKIKGIEILQSSILREIKSSNVNFSSQVVNLNNKIAASEKLLTDKIDNIELILRKYISEDTKTTSDFQSRVDDRLKVQNYKIDNNSEIQGSTQSILVASCAFLISIIIYIAYKKFLFRVMEVEEERNGIY